MKRKITVTLLIAVLATMMSVCALATNELITSAKPGLLISPGPNRGEEIVEEYDTMPISLDEYDTMLITDEFETEEILEDEILFDDTLNNVIQVQLDGEYVNFTDDQGNTVNPEIINNRTMVPMRKIFEIFNANILWNNDTRTVVATTEEKEITLTINNDKAKVKNLLTNEEEEITLDSAPVILNNRTMVPVRFIAESLEKEVGWDADERTVIIIDFDKIVKTLEEKVPVLKELFELEIEPMESAKTESKITGKITYKDAETKSNNETVNFEGTLELNVNKEKEIEMFIELAFSGKGTIYNSLVEAGYKKISLGFVMADGSVYMMIKQDGEEMWTNLGSAIDMTELAMLNITQPTNVEEFVEVFKTAMSELDSTSYFFLQEMINLLTNIYSEDNLEITGTGSKQTLKYSINLKELINSLSSGIVTDLEGLEMNIEMVEKISNKKVDSAKLTLDLTVEEPTTNESFALDFKMDMEFTNANKDFDIKLPEVEVIEY